MVNDLDVGILTNIIEHCVRIEETLQKVSSLEEFSTNRDVQDILCFNILQIGELANHLSSKFMTDYKTIPWRKTIAMRNIIVHGYGTIKMKRVWETATQDIEPLHQYCEELLN